MSWAATTVTSSPSGGARRAQQLRELHALRSRLQHGKEQDEGRESVHTDDDGPHEDASGEERVEEDEEEEEEGEPLLPWSGLARAERDRLLALGHDRTV